MPRNLEITQDSYGSCTQTAILCDRRVRQFVCRLSYCIYNCYTTQMGAKGDQVSHALRP